MSVLQLIKQSVFVVSACFLAGCVGVYDQQFDCGVAPGIGCKSISTVNELIDNDQLKKEITGSSEKAKPVCKVGKALPAFTSVSSVGKVPGETISRHPEQTLRIWIAPHEDRNGDFIKESFVHTVITPGKWIEDKNQVAAGEIY